MTISKQIHTFLITSTLLFGVSNPIVAQSVTTNDTISARYTHLLQQLKTDTYSKSMHKKNTLTNPYFFPLFSGYIINFDFLFNKEDNQLLNSSQHMLNYIYTQKPWLVDNLLICDHTKKTAAEYKKEVKPKESFAQRYKDYENFGRKPIQVDEIPLESFKPNFWNFSSSFSFQMMQNYFSKNWYKGGESNHSFLTAITLKANFDNKRRIIVENKLEAKIGFRSSNSDTEHKYLPTADLLRLTNELGIRAINHWDYSASLQSWTQSCQGLKKNNKNVFSDFMSPFESVLSLGMKYRVTSHNKRFNMGLNLSPFACDFKYSDRKNLAPRFGIKKGHHKFEFGTNITMNADWKPWTNISLHSRLYYYTNYHRTLCEWENTINLQINRYLSSRIFLYPRFDDNARRYEDHSYFQFKEYLSLGVNLNF